MHSFNDTFTITLKNNVVELQIGGHRSSWEASWLQACKNNDKLCLHNSLRNQSI